MGFPWQRYAFLAYLADQHRLDPSMINCTVDELADGNSVRMRHVPLGK